MWTNFQDYFTAILSVKLSSELLKVLEPSEDQTFLLQKAENHTGHRDDEITQKFKRMLMGQGQPL